jgi:NAD+ kinase
MQIKKVLLIIKTSIWQRNKRMTRMFPGYVKNRMRQVHYRSLQVLQHVKNILRTYGIKFTMCTLNRVKPCKFDLLISIGGDGTFFAASHFVKRQPILGVNSDETTSIGVFTGATSSNFEQVLKKILEGSIKIQPLIRLKVSIGQRVVKQPVFNDILYTSDTPAVVTRYILDVDGKKEEQKSSGLWISTPAGSTGATLSAGGSPTPIDSKEMQFVVREPLSFGGYKFTKGFARKFIKITSLCPHSRIWIDGLHVTYKVPPGFTVKITPDAPPVKVLGFDRLKRQKLEITKKISYKI